MTATALATKRRATLIRWLGVALGVAMETGWIGVAAGVLQAFALRPPVLRLGEIALVVAAGVVLGMVGPGRFGPSWPKVGTALVLIVGVAGVSLAAPARDALAGGHPTAAFAEDPGGIFAGLALLRGFRLGERPLTVESIQRTLVAGIAFLALGAAMGGMTAEPFRTTALSGATVGAGLFVLAGLAALAVTAQAEVSPDDPAFWRRNPVWLALMFGALVTLVVLAIALAGGGPLITRVLEAGLALGLAPGAVLGVVLADRATVRRWVTLLLLWFGGALTLFALANLQQKGTPRPQQPGTQTPADQPFSNPDVAAVGVVLLLVAAVVVLIILRSWMRRRADLDEGGQDIRTRLEPGEGSDRAAGPPARRRWPWNRGPQTALQAWLALVADLRDLPDRARSDAETPLEHARRLGTDGLLMEGDLRMTLLAADATLATASQRPVTPPETRRAIGRWRDLRVRLRPRS